MRPDGTINFMEEQKLPLIIKGLVIKGWQRGRELGFPTVNIELPKDTLFPKQGIYAGTIKIANEKYNDKTFLTACSTGYNTTFDAKHPTIEAHIIDFDDEIYGTEVELILTNYLRDMIKFNNAKQLVEQIRNDIKKTRKLLKRSFSDEMRGNDES
jgi:riboflavin kinase / FMN adenylyltransferase